MKIRSLTLAMLASTVLTSGAVTSVALADDEQYKISDKPLELSIQMNHKRYPVYKRRLACGSRSKKANQHSS